MVKANANPTDKTGGTSEGCKCSAAGMACDGKDGSCCGKEGCSTMKDGKSSCCSKEGGGEMACCSTAGKSAAKDVEGYAGCGHEKKPRRHRPRSPDSLLSAICGVSLKNGRSLRGDARSCVSPDD